MDNQLDSLIQKFLQEKARIEARRNLWRTTLKKRLEDNLNDLVRSYNDVGWYVHGNNDQDNYESLYLSINNASSGIKDKDGRWLMLMGGALLFSQTHNGKICVWMEYPYVEDLAYHNPSHEVIEVIEPEDLDTNNIKKFVALFIQKQIEKVPQDRIPIGFHR